VKFADLEKKRDIVVKILSELEETKESFGSFQAKLNDADQKISLLNKLSRKLEEDLKEYQNKIMQVLGDQDKIFAATDKIENLENMLIQVEEEEKRLQKMRSWVAELQNQLERIRASQEDGLRSSRGASSASSAKQQADQDTVKAVLRLRKEGWGVDEIASTLKLSSSYVELILERYEK